ncbi:TatD family hydrolase, partial [Pandoraea sputorum]|uniref:TatD family hydrolase n=1 Tax=Pandoraea sputorum TaxID=93222 RepID=UPI0035565A87
MLETDAPDMAPAMHAHQRNSPQYLPDICRALAALMGISAEQLAQASTANAMQILDWASQVQTP